MTYIGASGGRVKACAGVIHDPRDAFVLLGRKRAWSSGTMCATSRLGGVSALPHQSKLKPVCPLLRAQPLRWSDKQLGAACISGYARLPCKNDGPLSRQKSRVEAAGC